MEQFKDAHYFHIPSQGNIYTMTELRLANDKTLILAASLKRDIYYLEYLEGSQGLAPSTKEVSFTYIPSGAEIISIDAFNKSTVTNEVVIGITIIKNSNDSDALETFLNIYSQLDEHEDFNLENIAQNCLTVELKFVPFKLLHTYLVTWDGDEIANKEIVFLLAGNDNSVHVYRENSTDHTYKEVDCQELFPEFVRIPSAIVWIDTMYINNYAARITAFGCECGFVKFVKVDTKTRKVTLSMVTRLRTYISQVYLYLENDTRKPPDSRMTITQKQAVSTEKPIVNMVALETVLPAMLYRNILKYGLSDHITLHRPRDSTVLTCCLVADIDFDGDKEILIGTSSQQLFFYKFNKKEQKWYLEENREIVAPVLSMKYVDITGDGVRELVVNSLKGIHVLRHNPEFMRQKLKERIDVLTKPKGRRR